jgi:hypothetical protein
MIRVTPARNAAATPLDLAKRDLALVLGGRTFAVRAYLDRRAPDGLGWHTVIIENRTPLNHDLMPTEDPEACLNAAIRFLTAAVAADAADRQVVAEWESEGGVLLGRGERSPALPSGMEGTMAP